MKNEQTPSLRQRPDLLRIAGGGHGSIPGADLEKALAWHARIDGSVRGALGWLALAFLLHAPLVPFAYQLGLSRLIDRAPPVSRLPPVSDIPVGLLEETPPPKEHERKRQPRRETRTKHKTRSLEAAAPKPPASPQRPPHEPVAPGPLVPRDPVTVSGGDPSNTVDAGANARLLLHCDRLREHGLAEQLTSLTEGARGWRDLVGVAAFDPGKHVERMLIVGSELRDVRDLVAILELSIPAPEVKNVLHERIEAEPDGGWLDAPVALARLGPAGSKTRYAALPLPQTVMVVPEAARRTAETFSPKSRLAPAARSELASIFLAKPWHTLAPLSLDIPRTLRAAKLRLLPGAEGGITLQLVVQDESEVLAKAHTEALARELEAVAQRGAGARLFEKPSIIARGVELRGEIEITRPQLETLLRLLRRVLEAP